MSGGRAGADHGRMTTRPRATAWTLYLLTLASALPLGAKIASANPADCGCSGIGFGCSLYGWDAAGFALLLLGVPYAVILAALLGVLCLLPARYAVVAKVVAGFGLAVPWLAVLALSA